MELAHSIARATTLRYPNPALPLSTWSNMSRLAATFSGLVVPEDHESQITEITAEEKAEEKQIGFVLAAAGTS